MARIKDLPKILRPREKLIRYGPAKLTDSELLAIILRSGKKGQNVIALAKSVLKKFGAKNLPDVAFDDLKTFSGIGPTKACEIIACFELSKRLLKDKKFKLLMTPKDVWQEFKDVRNLKKEHFFVFFLDSRNQIIQKELISVGSLNANLVHPREVFEPAIKNSAAQLILAHNHPSGDTEPSEDDLVINKRLVEAGKIMGIEVIDHIIITKDKFLSLKEKGLI